VTLSPLSGLAAGVADDRLGAIVERLDDALAGEPDLSFQVAAYHDGALVLDAVYTASGDVSFQRWIAEGDDE
jgi:hypothetical protein